MRMIFVLGLLNFITGGYALAEELGSEAYILSHFHYANSARISQFQKSPLPTSGRVLPCGDQLLPASPGQETKAYHFDALITFQTNKVHAENQMPPKLPSQDKEGVMTHTNYCRMENKNNPNLNPSTGTKWCSMARVGRYTLMSDVFQDTCGGFFRGYWETAAVIESYAHGKPQYTSPEEHAVTSSIGRYDSMQKDPRFSGAFEFIPGPTGEVPVARLLFLVKASEKDLAKTNKVLERQLFPKGNYFRCKDGSYGLEKKNCVN